ncbi:MAG: protein kinase [Simkaniaceae bacterium]|nr:protein kinase [Simkaniaceae bacterium]
MAILSTPDALQALTKALLTVTLENVSDDQARSFTSLTEDLNAELKRWNVELIQPEWTELARFAEKLFEKTSGTLTYNTLGKTHRESIIDLFANWKTFCRPISAIFSSCTSEISKEQAKAIDDSRRGLKTRIKIFNPSDKIELDFCKALQTLFKQKYGPHPYYFNLTPDMQARAIELLKNPFFEILPQPDDRILGSGNTSVVYQKTEDLAVKQILLKDRYAKETKNHEMDAFRILPPHRSFVHPLFCTRIGIYMPKLPDCYTTFDPHSFSFTPDQYRDIISQLLLGVDHLNSHSLKHGDLSHNNVLVSPEGGVKIIDLGLVAALEERFAGTPYFTAPETLLDSASDTSYEKSDVYAAGVLLLYFIFTEKYYYLIENFSGMSPAFVEILNVQGEKDTLDSHSLLSILEKHLPEELMEIARELFEEPEYRIVGTVTRLMTIFYKTISQDFIDSEIDRVLNSKSKTFPRDFSNRLREGLLAALKLNPSERKTAREVHAIIFGS